ncbi:hypothetical protein ACIBU0_42510 [Streptomyces sp. NPDC049627]|uniref:hypothetical protein n=1 Tax=Streptomyces sp. NPDC049627 TaxID=3365595 RepID=UPI0037AD0A64
MTTTAAAAARHAAVWAGRAETAHETAVTRRAKGRELESQRLSAGARDWYERAEGAEKQRGTAVTMANMWANVAGVLHLAEEGEPS